MLALILETFAGSRATCPPACCHARCSWTDVTTAQLGGHGCTPGTRCPLQYLVQAGDRQRLCSHPGPLPAQKKTGRKVSLLPQRNARR
uniref:Uncharacterized protein n=1 Tax=Malurus cyaneus samueli TaxID=2593467 RepID=A0A8C5XAD0_9PASS